MTQIRDVYRGRLISVRSEETTLPNGVTATFDVVRHPGAAAAVPVDKDGEVFLVRQFRHAAGGFLWELPAGRLESGEDPIECARRELREEAGLEAADLSLLGTVLTAPGYSDEQVSLYLARGLVAGKTGRESDEVLSVRQMSLSEAVELIYEGQIQDAKTVIGLLLAQRRLGSSSPS